MRRSDRRSASDDNAHRHPQSRQAETVSPKELQRLLATVRSQRDEAQQQAKEQEEQASSYLALYDGEKARSSELQVKYDEALKESQHYLTLYREIEQELKIERRSKAGIKSWETRRKRENERLKAEISEMTLLLRESLTKKDQAVRSLEEVAARMDRIQSLVDSVDGEAANNPVGLLQKLQRIWGAIREILAE